MSQRLLASMIALALLLIVIEGFILMFILPAPSGQMERLDRLFLDTLILLQSIATFKLIRLWRKGNTNGS